MFSSSSSGGSKLSTEGRKNLSRKSLPVKNRDTPYVLRTPRVRELQLRNSSANSGPNTRSGISKQPSGFEVTFKTWRTFKISPLFNFHYSEKKLQEYEKLLSSYIEKERKKNIGVLIDQEHNYSVHFSVISGLAVSADDNKAVRIEVIQKGDENAKPVFVGILVSVERETEHWEKEVGKGSYTVLPLLLVSGRQIFVKSLAKFLEDRFTCVTQPLTFSSYHLTWMLAMWAGSSSDMGMRSLLLEYALPMKNLHTIQYSLSAKAVLQIWKRVHNPAINEMNIEEVKSFISCLEKHFFAVFSIDVSHLQLACIGTTAAYVNRNGTLKILNDAAVLFVLRHLTHLAQELNAL